jgi:septal ring-binding cell division protein DamX
MVANQKPQLQVNNILNMASLCPRANKEIPESKKTLAGYILMLLLTLSYSHVLVQWTGLDENTGAQDLFQRALNLHPACPTPLSTPARVNRDLAADLNPTSAPDEGPSQDDDSAADQKPAAATNNNDRATKATATTTVTNVTSTRHKPPTRRKPRRRAKRQPPLTNP